MSDNVEGFSSIYFKELPTESQNRYREKLKVSDEEKSLPDPYSIQSWNDDPSNWPELEFAQVYVYLIETPSLFNSTSMKAYKSLEAYRYVESGHVQEVKYFDVVHSKFCFLKADVVPSMRTKEIPHRPWVCLHKDSADVYCAHCTCLAGLGECCSHIAAVLFKIELGVRFGLNQKSVTSEACKWNKVFKKQVEPSPLCEYQSLLNSNRKKVIKSVKSSGRDSLPNKDVLQSLRQVCPNASFFSLIPPLEEVSENITQVIGKRVEDMPRILVNLYQKDNIDLSPEDLQEKCDELFHQYQCTEEQRNNLFHRTTNQSICPLWFQHRKGRVTGTKAHDILVRKESTPPDNLVMRIMDYKSYDLSRKDCVKWGQDHESTARALYIVEVKDKHSKFQCANSGFLIHPENFFAGATADGIIECECCGKGVLEIKCPYKHRDITVKEASVSDKDFCLNKDMTLKKNHRYFTQIQFQMSVYGCDYCDFVVMTMPNSQKSLYIVRIRKDDNFCNLLMKKSIAFIKDHILPEILTRQLQQKPSTSKPVPVTNWCVCNEAEYGKMIRCDSDNCLIGWFHYGCVDIRRKPQGKWFCPRCKK